MITLKIKPDTEEIGEWYKQHSYVHEGDIGLDLFCANEMNCEAESKAELDFGISCELVSSWNSVDFQQVKRNKILDFLFLDKFKEVYSMKQENLSYLLVPRSSITKTPLIMQNSLGIIDNSFRGKLKAIVYNPTRFNYIVYKKDRLFQIIRFNGQRINKIEIVSSLSETTRGENGFGSTGR